MQKKKAKILYFIFSFIVVITIGVLLVYNMLLSNYLSDVTYQTLGEIMEQQKLTFVSKLEGDETPNSIREEGLFFSAFSGKSHAFICDSKGNVISRTQSLGAHGGEELFTEFSQVEFIKFDTYEEVLNNMQNNRGGRAEYVYEGNKILMLYTPTGIYDWYIVSLVPEQVVVEEVNRIMAYTIALSIIIIALFLALVVYLIITQHKYSNSLMRTAYYNELTSAPNLTLFKIEGAKRLLENPDVSYCILRFNIDGLNFLNEIYGFTTGDTILSCTARALETVIHPPTEAYSNMFGDRFYLLFKGSSYEDCLKKKAEFEEVLHGLIKNDVSERVKFTMGCYVLEREDDIHSAMDKVSYAHRLAKHNSAKTVLCYDEQMKKEALFEKEVETKMEPALVNKEYTMFLQPKYRLSDETMVGAEALARWWVNGVFIMYPTDFIPVFEKNGFVTKLDMYMFEQACSFQKRLMDEGQEVLSISVNFSRLHLSDESFVGELCAITDRYGVPRNKLEIELTESAILNSQKELVDVLGKLHKAGFTLSMDDFGSGYSSLGLLKDIPIDIIKIDRSFFEGKGDVVRANVVLSFIMSMARELNVRTVAEGVETKEQIDKLKDMGCEVVQGFYYAKPMPFIEFKEKYIH